MLLLISTLYAIATLAQSNPNSLQRLSVDSTLAPFYHGVASGDPLSDAVIIWTRITTQNLGNLTVTWKMATDTLFSDVVQSGAAMTNDNRDHTVKVDVSGLLPATYYYYQFEYDGRKSLIGRTKTAPVGDWDHLRFAVVSCADYENGYFNAYEHIAFRNDIDAVLHLGDYIYEYEVGGLATTVAGRQNEPPNEIITLSDYRIRYSHYRLDNQLRLVHQQYPMITTWDDHETANNSWFGGAENHTPGTEGDWFVRKNNGRQAYFEWLPVRESAIDSFRIYRKFSYSDLADIIVLDTRLEGREEQGGTTNQDPNRTILGPDQYNWLVGHLNDTSTQWKIVAQQVMMAPLGLGSLLTFNEDQWDGYPKERENLFDEIDNNNIENFVVLTGDIHTSWASDLILSGRSSVGVEFVTTSVTTANADLVNLPSGFDPSFIFPHIQYADLVKHGYLTLDITKDRVQSDWNYVGTIDQIDPSASVGASWFVNDGEQNLNEANNAAPGLINQAALAPLTVNNDVVGIASSNDVIVVGSYPNPFRDKFIVQYYVSDNQNVALKLVDLSGKTLLTEELNPNSAGVNYTEIDGAQLSAGTYILMLESSGGAYKKTVVRMD